MSAAYAGNAAALGQASAFTRSTGIGARPLRPVRPHRVHRRPDLLLGLGLLGVVMRLGLPPVLIAVILGPLAESSLREAMNNPENNPLTLINPDHHHLDSLLAFATVWSVITKIRERNSEDVLT